MGINGSLIGAGVLGVLLLVGGLSSCSTVDAGEVGLYNSYGKIDAQYANPGLHFINPLTTDMEKMSVQSVKKTGDTGIYTSDMQTAQVAFAVTYALDPNAAVRMRKTVGHEWEARLVPPVVESSIKTAFGRSTAVNAIANRNVLQSQIQSEIKAALATRGIRVESFQLTNIDYSDAFENSVERAQVATQNAIAARNATVQVREEAVQKEIRSKAEADAIQRQASAISANPAIVQMRAVEKWDGRLPENMNGSVPLPFINIK